MIIVACLDDTKLLRVAKKQSSKKPQTFGECYQAFSKIPIPPLKKDDNLFITAHGAYKGDEGKPVIGDSVEAHYWQAEDLYAELNNLFPANYNGKVFISACESADQKDNEISFAKRFKYELLKRQHDVPVFGQHGAVGLEIPSPHDLSKWQEVCYLPFNDKPFLAHR
jgi:hypothetical protein